MLVFDQYLWCSGETTRSGFACCELEPQLPYLQLLSALSYSLTLSPGLPLKKMWKQCCIADKSVAFGVRPELEFWLIFFLVMISYLDKIVCAERGRDGVGGNGRKGGSQNPSPVRTFMK